MNRTSLAIVLMLLAAAFAWLTRVIAGDIGSLPAFALSLAGGKGYYSAGAGVGGTVSSLQVPNVSTPAQQAVLGTFVLIGVMLGYLLWRVRKMVPREDRTRAGLVTSLVVVLASFFVLLVAGRAILELLVALAHPPSIGSTGISPALATVILTIGAGIAGLSLASLILFLLRRRIGLSPPIVDKSYGTLREFSDVVEGTLYSLRSGADFRLAVLRCYASLRKVLQDGGASDSPELTAREFEAIAVKKLGIGEINIQRITELFEKARYSRDIVDEGDARDAEASLASLVREVRACTVRASLTGARM